ncbi:MAG: hypothetical protein M0Z54_05570 [Thermaerobacter sp.]|nr:hypothetical protein [Thermaerobacter sp.]
MATYAPGVQGAVWLAPLGWLVLAASLWGLSWLRLSRQDVLD